MEEDRDNSEKDEGFLTPYLYEKEGADRRSHKVVRWAPLQARAIKWPINLKYQKLHWSRIIKVQGKD